MSKLYVAIFCFCFYYACSQNINISTGGTVNICSGHFYDSGGSNNDYLEDEDGNITLCSNNNECLSVTFTSFDLTGTDAELEVLYGTNSEYVFHDYYTATHPPGTITGIINSNGKSCLTFNFYTLGSDVAPGWEAEINCNACPSPNNQDCPNAIPICQSIYTTSASYSGAGNVLNEINKNTSCLSGEKNDVWYTFTAQQSGDFSFLITPNNNNDDYDWAVYDLTGRKCADIYTNPSLEVSCNFAQVKAPTGANGGSSHTSQGISGTSLNDKIHVNVGETYVLNVSNFSSSQNGYVLDFSSSTASIFDVTPPSLKGIHGTISCSTSSLSIEFSENIKCSTINPNDFTISGPGGTHTVTSLYSSACASSSIDSYDKFLTLIVNPVLSIGGTYTICIKPNSLSDLCNNVNTTSSCQTFSLGCLSLLPKAYSTCVGKCAIVSSNAAFGGTPPYSYSWSPSIGTGIGNFTVCPTSTKIYTVSVTDAASKTVTTTVSVNLVNSPTLTVTPSSTTITCTSSQTVQLIASGATNYTWSPSASLNTSFSSSVVSTPPVGSTIYTLTGESLGCVSTNTLAIYKILTPLVINISPNNPTICVESSATLTTTGATSYTWTPSLGLNTTNSASVIAEPTTTTVYTVTGSDGTCNGFSTATVNVSPSLVIDVSPISPTICAGGSGTLLTVSGATNYTWSPSIGLSGTNGNTVIANPSSNTIYTITASDVNCTGSTTVEVIVVNSPTVVVSPISSTICASGTTTLVANGASTYTWSPSSGLNTTSNSTVIANPNSATVYTVSSSVGTCTATATTTVDVISVPSITVTPTNTNLTCTTGQTVTLTASGASTYTWIPSSSLSTANGATVISTPPSGTTIYTVTGSNGTCLSTATATVTNTISTLNLITTPISSTICVGQTTMLTVSGAINYTWSPSTSLNITTGSTVIANPTSTTIYTITGTDVNCTGIATVEVVVAPTPTITITPTSTTICQGNSTTLIASGASNYVWMPSTTLSTTLSPTTVASPTTNTTYTVLGSVGTCTNISTTTVDVISTPSITVTPTNTTICPGQTTTLIVTGGTSYIWTPSNSLSSNTNSVVTADPTVTTTYTVSSPSCVGITDAIVTVNVSGSTSSIPIISGPTTLCANATSVTYSVTNNVGSSYAWSVPSSATITSTPTNSNSITVDFAITGGTITVNETTSCGTSTASIVITSVPSLSITVSPNNPAICVGSSATLTATGATSYTWTPSLGLNTTNSASVIAEPTTTTVYTVTGSDGTCNGFSTATVDVIPTPSITVTPAYTNLTCTTGQTVTLTASGASTYTWIPSSNLNTTNGSTVIATPPTGTTIYTVTGSNGTCSSTATATFTNTISALNLITTPISSTICVGQTTTLTVSGAINYTWSPSTSLNITTGSTVIANPTSTTIYTITGTDVNCTGIATVEVIVTPTPTISITSTSTTICEGASVALIADGASNYTWTPSNSLSSNSGSVVIANPSITTTYTLVGVMGTCSNTISTTVNVYPNPTITIAQSNIAICVGDNVTIISNGANTYTWSPGTGLNTTTGNVVIANPTSNIVYTVSATSLSGCLGTNTISVIVNPSPTISISAPTNSICAGTNATLTATGANSYTWSPAGSLSSATTSTVTANPITTTVYTITGVNGNNCQASSQYTLTVIPAVTATISPSDSVCLGSGIPLTISGGNSYTWTPSSSLDNSNSSNPIASPSVNTTYTVNVSNGGLCFGTATVTIFVNPLPLVNAGNDVSINIGDTLTLNGTGTGVLEWINASGLSCTLCPKPTAMPIDNTCYTLQAINNHNCTNIDVVCVEVTKDYALFFPNTFTPDGDLLNDEFLPKGFGISEIEFFVFDRWGELIYTGKNLTKGWDGKYKGKMSQNGVYPYTCTAKTISGKQVKYAGYVTLLATVK